MKSMTGYGRGESVRDGLKVIAELSSVNRKQAEIAVNLPRELEMLDAPLRDLVHRHIARGRLTGRVTLHTTNGRWDIVAEVRAESLEAFDAALGRIRLTPGIANTETSILLSTYKA